MSNTFTCNIKGVKSSYRSTARATDEEIKILVDETLNTQA